PAQFLLQGHDLLEELRLVIASELGLLPGRPFHAGSLPGRLPRRQLVLPCSPRQAACMRTKREWQADLEELLPTLEAEHDAAADEDVRDALWKLLSAAEEYLLLLDEKKREAGRGG